MYKSKIVSSLEPSSIILSSKKAHFFRKFIFHLRMTFFFYLYYANDWVARTGGDYHSNVCLPFFNALFFFFCSLHFHLFCSSIGFRIVFHYLSDLTFKVQRLYFFHDFFFYFSFCHLLAHSEMISILESFGNNMTERSYYVIHQNGCMKW